MRPTEGHRLLFLPFVLFLLLLFAGACGGESTPSAGQDSGTEDETKSDDESADQDTGIKFKKLSPKQCANTQTAKGSTIPITNLDTGFKAECTSGVPKGRSRSS